jgi:hypothetical protein
MVWRRRTQVVLIEILNPVREKKIWNEDQVELGDEPALFFRVVFGEPLDLPPLFSRHAAVRCHGVRLGDVKRLKKKTSA